MFLGGAVDPNPGARKGAGRGPWAGAARGQRANAPADADPTECVCTINATDATGCMSDGVKDILSLKPNPNPASDVLSQGAPISRTSTDSVYDADLYDFFSVS